MLPLVRLPSLDLIKGFVAVARRMSITQAADDLCLSQSAVSKQIRALEDSLGVPLFTRGFRSLALTEHGQVLFQAANQSLLQLQEVLALFGPQRRRPVTVTASTGIAGLWLLPRLGDLQRANPNIDVRLVASNAVLELGPDVDLAIRYCAERQAPHGAIKLFGETIRPVASPEVARQGLTNAAQLSSLTLLEFDVPGRPWLHWAHWLAMHAWNTASAGGVLLYNQYDQVIQAALAGQGVALGRMELLQDMVSDGRLQPLPTLEPNEVHSQYAYWLVQADKDPVDDVRRVVEWLLSEVQGGPAPDDSAP
jgi:LysR family glycine cleavage system transcriptional activator